MSRLKYAALVFAVLFGSIGITLANSGSIVWPISGELDYDGDVDFTDFLIFTENFGKSGPVPND